MKRLAIGALCVSSIAVAMAQYSVNDTIKTQELNEAAVRVQMQHTFTRWGRITDGNDGSPIGLASVAFLNADSAYIGGTVADTVGIFTLPDYEFCILRVTAPSYNTLYEKKQQIKDGSVITLDRAATALREVSVTASKKPYMIKKDMLVFDPEFAVHASNAAEILKVSPGLIDTGGSVTMPGKLGLKILVNGKELRGTQSDAMTVLSTYPASEVERVEVIYAPSARYTQGQPLGAVNIVLKKHPESFLGISAYYSLVYDHGTTAHYPNGVIHYTGDKLYTSLSVAVTASRDNEIEDRTYNTTATSGSEHSDIFRRIAKPSVKWGLDYTLTPSWSLSVSAMYASSSVRGRDKTRWSYDCMGDLPETGIYYGRQRNNSHTWVGSVETTGKLSSAATLTASLDYYGKRYPTERFKEDSVMTMAEMQSNDMKSDNVTGRTTIEIVPGGGVGISLGTDYTRTYTESDAEYISAGVPAGSIRYRYNEYQWSAYAQVRYEITRRLSVEAEARYVDLLTKGADRDVAGSRFRRHTGVAEPSVGLGYRIDDASALRLSAYYNLAQPAITQLNPAVLYLGGNSYRVGNPSLREARHFGVGAYYFWRSLIVNPYFDWLNHGVAETGTAGEDGRLVYTWANSLNSRSYGLMAQYRLSGPKWMSLAVSTYAVYKMTRKLGVRGIKADGMYWRVWPTLSVFTPDRKLSLTLEGMYSTSEKTIESTRKPIWDLDITLVWKPDSHWRLMTGTQNLLHSRTRGTLHMENADMHFSNKYDYTTVFVGATYTWGQRMRYRQDRRIIDVMDSRTEIK